MSTEDRQRNTTVTEQTITVPLPTGSRVLLEEEVDTEVSEDGEVLSTKAQPIFEDWVERHSPESGLIEFSKSDIGRAELLQMVEEADSLKIVTDEDVRNV